MRNAEFWNYFYFSREKRGISVYPFLRKNGANTSKTRRGEGAYKEVRDRTTTLYCEVYPPFFIYSSKSGGKYPIYSS